MKRVVSRSQTLFLDALKAHVKKKGSGYARLGLAQFTVVKSFDSLLVTIASNVRLNFV